MKVLFCIWAGLWAILSPGIETHAGAIKRDFQALPTWENAGIIALGMGMAGIVHRWDDRLAGQLEGNPVFEATSDPSNIYGSSTFNLPAAFGLWLFSRAAKRPKLEAVSCDILRALGFNQLLVAPIKHGVRRKRPDGSNRLSFPSGHTANAFAIAGVLNNHYGPRVGLPFYAWSILVAGGRMEDDRHFLSDVVAGAAIGLVVGRSISRAEPKKVNILPVAMPRGVALTLGF